MGRVLKPGGFLLLNVPFLYWIHEVPHDFHRYTEYALRKYAEAADFRVETLRPLGGTREVVADLLAKKLVGLGFPGGVVAHALQSFTRASRKGLLGPILSRSSSGRYPLFYSLVAQKNKAGIDEDA